MEKSASKSGVNAPFKSPLRSRCTDQKHRISSSSPSGEITIKKPAPILWDDSLRGGEVIQLEHDNLSVETDLNEEKGHELDGIIKSLEKKICKIRNLEAFTIDDVEEELKAWRELLHDYNDAKDACLYIFGQLAHLKMTTIKHLYEEYNLDINT